MAGAGYRLFNTGDVLTAAQVNTYLQEQTVMVFADATARTTALSGVLAEGMVSYLQDTNAVQVYNGSAWVNIGEAGDITAVNVTSPITGGGSSGDVTIGIQDGTTAQKGAVQLEDSTSSTSTTKAATPNSVKSAYDLANGAIAKSLVDAAGDLIYGTADNTVARLGIGTAGQVLKVNSGATAPEWGAAAASALTLVKSQTIGSAVSAVTVTDAFSSTYDNYLITVAGGAGSANNNLRLTLGATATGYYWSGVYMGWNNTVNGFGSSNGTFMTVGYGSTNAESANIILQSPNLAKRTVLFANMVQPDTSGIQANYSGYLNDSTQYTAFTLTLDTGTMTGGVIRVYGYQNS